MAGADLLGLVPDRERQRAFQHHPVLLVLVVVLRHLGARLELDEREGDLLAVDGPADGAVPDPLRLDLAEVVECAHEGSLTGTTAVCRNRHVPVTDTSRSRSYAQTGGSGPKAPGGTGTEWPRGALRDGRRGRRLLERQLAVDGVHRHR